MLITIVEQIWIYNLWKYDIKHLIVLIWKCDKEKCDLWYER